MKIVKISTFILAGLAVTACVTNPVTGRSSIQIANNSEIATAAASEYRTTLSSAKVVTGTSDANRVKNVGAKIKNAAYAYYKNIGRESDLANYSWEFNLIQDKQLNAWCMPGGKIVVYSGILPITQNDVGLATVMGHEVSHALANHGAQRMSASQLLQLGAVGVAVATGSQSAEKQQMWQQYYGMGSQVGVMLPFSRGHETEADKIGLTLMAIAGYNHEEAITFWSRMAAQSSGQAPPEFMSTHPSDATRIANLKVLIPEAKALAAKVGVLR